MKAYIRELESGGDNSLHIETAIGKLRDEITAYLMGFYRGNNRNLAMTLTKLDEAKFWATQHAIDTGRIVTVDRAELLRAANEV